MKNNKLSIKELALFKTNPQQYYKIQRELIVKHPINERAKYIGSKCITLYDEATGHNISIYPDGTEIREEAGVPVHFSDSTGFMASLTMQGHKPLEWSNYDGIETEEDRKNAQEFAFFRERDQAQMDRYLKGEITKKQLLEQEKYFYEGHEVTSEEFDKAQEAYDNKLQNTRFDKWKDAPDFYTVQIVEAPDERNLRRRIVSSPTYNEAHLSQWSLTNEMNLNQVYENIKEPWTIITKYPSGDHQGRGIGNNFTSNGADSMSDTLISPRYQKFKREIIDEKNHRIIQVPYIP